MKKVYKLEELDCANCAAKMERAIAALDGVEHVAISFMTSRLTIEADESRLEEILQQAERCIRKIEPDCRIVR